VSPIATAKITLTLTAAILFGLGIRNDTPALRWAAIAFLAIAVLLRFFDRSREKR
jgi:nanoRNase/pAp phosphatase (c-di-AMP/oligoRNAs hydrolase)